MQPGSTFVDVGCGRGGPGVWVAARTGATLIGLDIAEAPLVEARGLAVAFRLDATFQRGEFEAPFCLVGRKQGNGFRVPGRGTKVQGSCV